MRFYKDSLPGRFERDKCLGTLLKKKFPLADGFRFALSREYAWGDERVQDGMSRLSDAGWRQRVPSGRASSCVRFAR